MLRGHASWPWLQRATHRRISSQAPVCLLSFLHPLKMMVSVLTRMRSLPMLNVLRVMLLRLQQTEAMPLEQHPRLCRQAAEATTRTRARCGFAF